jgi:murein L,D-transpeptidase YcbB/YkuD
MFRVWGMGDARAPLFSAEVIVGRALRTRTPVLLEQMEYVIFRPYWNIPGSILHGEILSALRRSPGYLQRHEMEIVAGDSDSGRVVPPTAENIAGLREGTLRLRQRPGARNSLGLVKFVFPNDANVYMHGTPAPELFAHARRDFSHGCIRVSDPVGLAEWVLSPDPAWTRERIVSAMNGASPLRVDLARPIPVILFYTTAMPIGGAMHFAEDIYGHDARLDRYLAAARGQRMATE